MTNNLNSLKRYNLAIPTDLFDEIKDVADKRHISLVELLRKFIKIGLIVSKVEDNPNAAIIIREDSQNGSGVREREIILY